MGEVYRHIGRWANDYQQRLFELVRIPAVDAPASGLDPYDAVDEALVRRQALVAILPPSNASSSTREIRAIARGFLAGLGRTEIAKSLGIKPARVDYVMRGLRRRAYVLLYGEAIDPSVGPGIDIGQAS